MIIVVATYMLYGIKDVITEDQIEINAQTIDKIEDEF